MLTLKNFFLFLFVCSCSLWTYGTEYEGIGKANGQMMDLWITIDINNNQAQVDLGGGALKFTGICKRSGTAQNPVYQITADKLAFTLKSADAGSTLEGKLPLGNNNFLDLWLLKKPNNLVPSTLSDQELKTILESKDGYTSFIQMITNEGTQALTSDFMFEPNGSYKFFGDSTKLDELLEKINGSYQVSNGEIIFKLGNEMERRGIIYNNGDYIRVPLGQVVRGGNFTIVLIK